MNVPEITIMEERGETCVHPDSSQLLSFINETEIPCAELLPPLSVRHARLPPRPPVALLQEMCDAALRVSGTMDGAETASLLIMLSPKQLAIMIRLGKSIVYQGGKLGGRHSFLDEEELAVVSS